MKKWKNKKELHLFLASVPLLIGAIGLLWAARQVTGFAEWYSKTVYPVLVTIIGGVFGLVPISVVELLLYLGIMLAVVLLIRYRRKTVKLAGSYLLILSSLLFLYAACCGVNYYRIPFSSYYMTDLQTKVQAQKEKRQVETVSLYSLCAWLTEEVNRAYEELENSAGNYTDMQEKGIAAMKRLAQSYPALEGHYPQPKPVMISEILSVQQCSGVYSPFTIEANYNNDMVSYNIPHTICHEMSHLRGFMREDEANFIGYLACIQSEDADFRFSGYMLGWIYAGNALAKIDYPEYERLHGLLNREIVAQFEENSAFWAKYEGEVAEVQEKVNDAYLKANGQSDGVLSYGRVVDLMLVDYVFNRDQ